MSKPQITVSALQLRVQVLADDTLATYQLTQPMVRELRRAANGKTTLDPNPAGALVRRGLIEPIPEAIRSNCKTDAKGLRVLPPAPLKRGAALDCGELGHHKRYQPAAFACYYCTEFRITKRGRAVSRAIAKFEEKAAQ